MGVLTDLSKPSAEKDHFDFKLLGVERGDNGSIKSLQCDRGDKITIFTIKRYQQLVAEGKIVDIDDAKGTFKLKKDPDFKPGNNFQPVDLA